MYTKTLGLIIGLALLGTFSSVASARPHREHKLHHLSRALERLHLPADVRVAIEQQLEAGRTSSEPIHEQLRTERKRMRHLMEAELLDKSAILAQAEVIDHYRAELHKFHLALLVDIALQLTPEQRAELRQMRAGRRLGARIEEAG